MSSLYINVHYVPGGRACRPGPRYWDNLKGGLRTSLRSALSHRFRNIPVKPSPEVAEIRNITTTGQRSALYTPTGRSETRFHKREIPTRAGGPGRG